MLKKVFHIVISGVIFFISSGFSIQNHYCGGKLAFIKPASVFNEKGCCGEEGLMDGCCKNEIKYFKVSDYTQTHILSNFKNYSFVKLFLPLSPVNFYSLSLVQNFSVNYLNYKNKSSSPPLLYLLHCILLI